VLKQIVDEFTFKDNQFHQEIDQLEKNPNANDSFGGLHHKQRIFNIIRKQIEQKEKELDKRNQDIEDLNEKVQFQFQTFEKVVY